MDRYLTTRDVVELTTLSRATVERKVKAGDMPAPVYISTRRKAFRESQIREWMNSKEREAA